MPGRFKDFIAMPKFNAYQSLHTTVIGPEGKPLEIQIRTRQMHETAELGIAAHWAYKRGEQADDQWLAWVKQLMDWQADEADPRQFMRNFRTDLFDDEVFVFTPAGEVKTLPAGATPIDFAYAVHTDVGHRTVGAKVNGRIVPLHYRLKSGDFVEILTSKSGRGPSRDWMSRRGLVARTEQDPAVVLARDEGGDGAEGPRGARGGAEAPEPALSQARRLSGARAGDPRLRLQEGGGLLPRARFGQAAAGADRQEGAPAPEVGGRPEEETVPRKQTRAKPIADDQVGVVVRGAEGVLVRLAKCCTPVPGDEISGYISLGKGVTIHRNDVRT